ncbi:MAG: amino acid ABC transporter permease [Zavarzinia sp.]|nr:amino acid ABC transporter permease [Zavarzinia sp.]
METLPLFLKGTEITLAATLLSSAIGILIATILAIMQVSKSMPAKIFANAYILTFRSIPLLVTIIFLYYGLPVTGLYLSAFFVGILGLALTLAAYASEVIRAGIVSIPRGQLEAAAALGLRRPHILRHVVLPQALMRILPPMTNQVITNLKNTSLLSAIAITDILRTGIDVMTWKANTFSPFAAIALCYLALIIPLSILARWLEARLARRLHP